MLRSMNGLLMPIEEEYNENQAFALTKSNEEVSQIYGENKINECSVIPVILAPKKNLSIQ